MWMANAQTFGSFFPNKKDKHDIRQDVSSHYYFNNISTFNKTTGSMYAFSLSCDCIFSIENKQKNKCYCNQPWMIFFFICALYFSKNQKIVLVCTVQCWTVGTIFTFGRSRMFGPDKLQPLAVGRSRSRRIKNPKTYITKFPEKF